jgi:hypothetical protein
MENREGLLVDSQFFDLLGASLLSGYSIAIFNKTLKSVLHFLQLKESQSLY